MGTTIGGIAAPDAGEASGFACLSLLLGFLQIPTDVSQLRHAAGTDAPDAKEIVRLARRLGARAAVRSLAIGKLARTPLPIIASAYDGSFFLIAGMRDQTMLVQSGNAPPEAIELEELERRWTG